MPVVGANSNLMPYDNSALGDVLNTVLSAGKNKIQDKIYRQALKKELGVDSDSLTIKEMIDLQKEKVKESFKPKEWKPTTKEERLEVAQAEAGFKNAQDIKKDYAKYIIEATKSGSPKMSFSEYKKLYDETVENPEAVDAPAAAPAGPEQPKDWGDVGILGRIMAAITPSRTPEEKVLGTLRPGGIVMPPNVNPQGSGAPAAASVAPAAPIAQYTPEEESLITENMLAHKRSRDEVIAALTARGMLKGQ